ncbi:hypothetical protein ACRASX_01410 [Flavobacterium sp. TMP13]|uniref:hypothetical protein n=1 Tax=unclassified Flavobacterium TaxID=196869 RepID=UPI000B1F6784|nr:hypothetical protein [Flavobacterium sp. TAB 87]
MINAKAQWQVWKTKVESLKEITKVNSSKINVSKAEQTNQKLELECYKKLVQTE